MEIKEHIDRLYAGLKILKVDIGMSKSEMEKVVYEVIENKPAFDDNDEHRILIDVSRGLLSLYIIFLDYTKVQI